MSCVQSMLIVGGGIAGMSLAIRMRTQGVAVDLIDRDPEWRVYGAGISLTGPTLRAFGSLGILDEVLAKGAFGNGLRICTKGGETLALVPLPQVAGADVPANGGILRPALHDILSRRTLDLATHVRLGLTVDVLQDEGSCVQATFSDGTRTRYDLVIGADGARSHIRRAIFPQAPELRPTGQGCWRLVAERPVEVDRPVFFLGGPIKVGLVPVSADRMYLFCLSPVGAGARVEEDFLVHQLAGLLAGFGGAVAGVRAAMNPNTIVVYRPLETLLLPAPWHSGRTGLIGDAAHTTTPHLASGAGISVEDALVLAEELAVPDEPEAALHRFVTRRYERCRLVVENSVELGRLELEGGPAQDHQALMAASARALAMPI